MKNPSSVLWFALTLTILVEHSAAFGNLVDRQFPLGTIGCLFTKNLCGPQSQCIDDFLFGTCSRPGSIGGGTEFLYELDTSELTRLREVIVPLVNDKFTWRDGYAQCVIQNTLLSLALGEEQPDGTVCDALLVEVENNLDSEINEVLVELFKNTIDNYDRRGQYGEIVPISGSDKRDEIVRLHKYFDQSKAPHKRRYPDNVEVGNQGYLSYYPRNDLMNLDPRSVPLSDSQGQGQEQGWEDSEIPLSNLFIIQQYLAAKNAEDDIKPKFGGSSLEDLFSQEDAGPSRLFPGMIDSEGLEPNQGYGPIVGDFPAGYSWDEGGDLDDEREEEPETKEMDEVLDSIENGEQELLVKPLSPPYANLLSELIRGDIEPDNLTDEELDFLTKYVSAAIERLNLEDDEDEEDEHEAEERMEDLPVTQPDLANAMETDMTMDTDFDSKELPWEETRAEQMILNGNSGPDLLSSDLDLQKQVIDKKDDTDKPVITPSDEGIPETLEQTEVVNTNFAFIIVETNLDDTSADHFIEELTKVTTANPGSLDHFTYKDNKLTIKVDPVLAGINASTLATQAKNHRKDLEKATGLQILKTGIGIENEVEIKSTDDSYFVLTFVLCGCIAGILLAVVIIYLIRRNTRSKEKLAQLATVTEGTEASNDYQDLCRQRMQSKSSEKPEPLHAASRVGSVSESQVRSPSSRSSTSSWSEEPVNSNMDISTGHIVLSYMEDHLKNKGRLEQEWEGLCAYEADPCSVKVAQDPANARKNRYSDILPFDHSRVVLSSSTNVSGSDYINANTITDHDPRNPAYIATQGPLPHTVADFWQMVWEQGSVVIVQLTKLTENGEAMCHRYWPEEGSDLYHIYEVHLVSEHIWCDDYLVRSFYLKNLQTNETRTVTQFHFLTWPDLGVPSSIKTLLDFRRKVNKSYRGRSCPIVVHCSDGCGRTGTYSLVDMVLNRMAKGAKEIDIAATLEHIRDQRINMVKTKEQFQFALAAVAEEVHAILKALPQ